MEVNEFSIILKLNCSQKDLANMKNEIEKRQREDENKAADQSTQPLEESKQILESTEATIAESIDNAVR